MSQIRDIPSSTNTHSASLRQPEHKPLWRNTNFLLLWSGQLISSIGSQVSLLAFPLLIFTLTGSPVQAAFLSTLRILPYLLFGLPAGALVDHWDRKRVMLFCDIARGLALGSIAVAFVMGRLTVPHIYIVCFVEGTLAIFFGLAETACLPEIVPDKQLADATAQNEFISSTAGFLGPSLSGFLYNLGVLFPFLADTISYIVSVIGLCFLHTPYRQEPAISSHNLIAEIREGVSWLWQHSVLRFLALLVGGLVLSCSGYVLILIVLVDKLGASPVTLGLILGCGGIGSIVGAFLAGPLAKRFAFGPSFITATWIWAITWLLFVVAPNPFVLGCATVCSFVIVPIHNTLQYTYRLKHIPQHLLGRVNSVFRLILFLCQALGIVLTGFLLQSFGAIVTVWLLFIPQCILAVITTLHPQLRKERE